MPKRILCVDDEEDVVRGLKRVLRPPRFETLGALSGAAGLELFEKEGPDSFDVVISDMRMPEMNGAQFLARIKDVAPDVSRILLTGQADVESSIAAVNDGQIFRFLTKPCPPETLRRAILDGVRQKDLIQAERVLLEETLNGAIDALMQVLAVSKPLFFGRARRVRNLARGLGEMLKVPNLWQLEIAAQFSQLGHVILPNDVARHYYYGRELGRVEAEMVARCPALVERMLKSIPRLEGVRSIVQRANERDTVSADRERDPEGFAAAILSVVTDIEAHEARGETLSKAVGRLKDEAKHHPEVLAALVSAEEEDLGNEALDISPSDLGDYIGGRLGADFQLSNDFLVAPRGASINGQLVELVSNYEAYCEIGSFPATMKVHPPRGNADSIEDWAIYS